jgi:hypothetical protein
MEALDEDFDAIVCPYCGSVLDASVTHCTNCGLRFKEEKSVIRSEEDEEFLSRLLDWGRKLEATRSDEGKSDQVETEQASEVLKDVIGVSPTSIQEETLIELQKSAEERDEFEKREESILQLAEPLRKALKVRKKTLFGAEIKLTKLQTQLEKLGEDDVNTMKQRSEIERRMAEISIEKDAIQGLEENIKNMDNAYRSLLEQHRSELIDKEGELKVRLDAFKEEMVRREKEKDKLVAREDYLKDREEELELRIQSLKDRENSLKKTEDKMVKEVEALKTEREGIEELKKPTAKFITAKGKWLVDEKEIKSILKKSKSVRETWLKEQKEIQKAFAKGESEEQVEQESQDRLDRREKELEEKIQGLEIKLAKAEEESEKLSKEEAKLTFDEKKLKKVLKVVDDLLGNLPDEMIEKFAKSKDYKMYEKLMDELGL